MPRNDQALPGTPLIQSDPCRKTVAIEIDYLNAIAIPGGPVLTESHIPDPNAINIIRDMFNNAPIAPVNPCPFSWISY